MLTGESIASKKSKMRRTLKSLAKAFSLHCMQLRHTE